MMSTYEYNKLRSASDYLLKRGFGGAKIAIVLGSGLGALAEEAEEAKKIDTETILDYPNSSVEGHHGRIVRGRLAGAEVLLFKGRVHYYEGYSPLESSAPVIVAHHLGAQSMLFATASGAINPAFQPGDLMVIEDFLNFAYVNPLRGLVSNKVRGGAIAIDNIADPLFVEAAVSAAVKAQIALHRGTYCFMLGASYETPAEVRFLKIAGADAVGMSTIPELIMARYFRMNTLAIAVLTNHAAGISKNTISHQEVLETTQVITDKFAMFMKELINGMTTQ
jgi:purine-nucleoside phosphorylase